MLKNGANPIMSMKPDGSVPVKWIANTISGSHDIADVVENDEWFNFYHSVNVVTGKVSSGVSVESGTKWKKSYGTSNIDYSNVEYEFGDFSIVFGRGERYDSNGNIAGGTSSTSI